MRCTSIAKMKRRSNKTINSFFKGLRRVMEKTAGGKTKALLPRDEKKILKLTAIVKFSVKEILPPTTGLKGWKEIICNTINRYGNLQYIAKMYKPPLLTATKFAKQVKKRGEESLDVLSGANVIDMV